jgi:hypothetical protein
VAWCAEFLTTHLKQQSQKLSDKRCGLKRLRYLNDKTSLGRDTTLQNYSNLVIVRDIIVHNAGILRSTSRPNSPDPLPDAVCALPGFSIRDDLFVWFGKSKFVTIERDALEPYIKDIATFLPALNKAADEAGLLNYDAPSRPEAELTKQ